jgi:hypothetical protein
VLARKVIGLLRVMSFLRVGETDSRSDERLSNHATRSPPPENLVVTTVSMGGGPSAVWSLRHGQRGAGGGVVRPTR